MAANDYLKGVRLERAMGSWVEPFAFDSAVRDRLSKWLTADAMAQLETSVELALSDERDRRAEASLADARTALTRIGDLSEALAKLLEMAPGAAQPSLLQIAHRSLGDQRGVDRLILSLTRLSLAAAEQAERLPAQSRGLAHPELITAIAKVVEPLGIKVSEATSSAFLSLSKCVFAAAGVPQDPRGSIRWLLKHRTQQRTENTPPV